MKRYLIATSKYPQDKQMGLHVFAAIRELGLEQGANVGPVIYWTNGPGCTNLAFETDKEEFAKQIAIVLGPISRWTETNSPLPEVDTVDCV